MLRKFSDLYVLIPADLVDNIVEHRRSFADDVKDFLSTAFEK